MNTTTTCGEEIKLLSIKAEGNKERIKINISVTSRMFLCGLGTGCLSLVYLKRELQEETDILSPLCFVQAHAVFTFTCLDVGFCPEFCFILWEEIVNLLWTFHEKVMVLLPMNNSLYVRRYPTMPHSHEFHTWEILSLPSACYEGFLLVS